MSSAASVRDGVPGRRTPSGDNPRRSPVCLRIGLLLRLTRCLCGDSALKRPPGAQLLSRAPPLAVHTEPLLRRVPFIVAVASGSVRDAISAAAVRNVCGAAALVQADVAGLRDLREALTRARRRKLAARLPRSPRCGFCRMGVTMSGM